MMQYKLTILQWRAHRNIAVVSTSPNVCVSYAFNFAESRCLQWRPVWTELQPRGGHQALCSGELTHFYGWILAFQFYLSRKAEQKWHTQIIVDLLSRPSQSKGQRAVFARHNEQSVGVAECAGNLQLYWVSIVFIQMIQSIASILRMAQKFKTDWSISDIRISFNIFFLFPIFEVPSFPSTFSCL